MPDTRMYSVTSAFLAAGEAPVVDFVPPLQRRRLSALQRIVFHLLAKLAPAGESWPIHFSSNLGEDSLTRRLVADWNEEPGVVSPGRFSTSVFNAAPGLWSIFAKNKASYTALAGTADEALETGLLHALLDPAPDVIWVHAEETYGGWGIALALSRTNSNSNSNFTTHETNAAATPLTEAQLVAFLRGEVSSLHGRWIDLSR